MKFMIALMIVVMGCDASQDDSNIRESIAQNLDEVQQYVSDMEDLLQDETCNLSDSDPSGLHGEYSNWTRQYNDFQSTTRLAIDEGAQPGAWEELLDWSNEIEQGIRSIYLRLRSYCQSIERSTSTPLVEYSTPTPSVDEMLYVSNIVIGIGNREANMVIAERDGTPWEEACLEWLHYLTFQTEAYPSLDINKILAENSRVYDMAMNGHGVTPSDFNAHYLNAMQQCHDYIDEKFPVSTP